MVNLQSCVHCKSDAIIDTYIFRLFSIIVYHRYGVLFFGRLFPEPLRTGDQVRQASAIFLQMCLERKSGWLVKREHKNPPPYSLAWRLPILPAEVCWQTNKSCQETAGHTSNLEPAFLSPPGKKAKRRFRSYIQLHGRSTSSPSPDLSHVHNKFTRGTAGNLGEKTILQCAAPSSQGGKHP